MNMKGLYFIEQNEVVTSSFSEMIDAQRVPILNRRQSSKNTILVWKEKKVVKKWIFYRGSHRKEGREWWIVLTSFSEVFYDFLRHLDLFDRLDYPRHRQFWNTHTGIAMQEA